MKTQYERSPSTIGCAFFDSLGGSECRRRGRQRVIRAVFFAYTLCPVTPETPRESGRGELAASGQQETFRLDFCIRYASTDAAENCLGIGCQASRRSYSLAAMPSQVLQPLLHTVRPGAASPSPDRRPIAHRPKIAPARRFPLRVQMLSSTALLKATLSQVLRALGVREILGSPNIASAHSAILMKSMRRDQLTGPPRRG